MRLDGQTTRFVIALLIVIHLGLVVVPCAVAGGSSVDPRRPLSAAGEDPNARRPDLAKMLGVTLNSVEFSAQIVQPFSRNARWPKRSLVLSVSFPYKGRHSIVGVDLANPVIREATDGNGDALALIRPPLERHRFEALRYAAEPRSGSLRKTVPPGAPVCLVLNYHQRIPASLSVVR